MNVKSILERYQFPEIYKDAILSFGINNLYPPQAACIDQGVLDGKSLMLAVPTAAGKTFIAELAMLKSIFENNGRCLYVAPLKALASEKFEDFKKKYSPLGIKVGITTGDFDSPTKFLNRYQILIATAEKVDSLIRSRAKWLINSLNVFVLDEVHFINDGLRGPTMEVLTARIKQLNPNLQILALSATVQNAKEVAGWLGAECIVSDWRPVPLKEGVYYNDKITFKNDPVRLVREEVEDEVGKLVLDTLRGKGQALVFVNSRRSAQAASRVIAQDVAKILTEEEKKELAEIAKQIVGSKAESTKICGKLSDVVRHGAAFHHAGLKPQQRKLVEDSFKKNLIKVICSTPTLAAGVNLPARRTILRDYKRYEEGLGAAYIPTFEYKQCAGRAGRPQFDKFGEAIIMAKTFSDENVLFERYINAPPEPIISKLGDEAALRTHILASIAGDYVHDINEMFDFINHTLLAHQRLTGNLLELITDIFDFLLREGFIEKNGLRYFATAFGQCISRLYLDPLSGIRLRDGLKKSHHNHIGSPVGLLHLICCCPDVELMNVGKNDPIELEEFVHKHTDEFIMTQADLAELEDIYFYFASLKMTSLLSRWIDEEKEDTLCDQFNIGPGDIHRINETIEWLLHAAGVIAELFEFKKLTFTLEDLRMRIQYGIREELLELVSLKGVGRIRARNLHDKGYKHLKDLKFASVDDLAKINQIGKTLAQDILSQLSKSRTHAPLTDEGWGEEE